MQVFDHEGALGEHGPIALALGTFDGVHMAHQQLLSECVQYARDNDMSSMAYCFKLPPIDCLSRRKSALLSTPEEKQQLIDQLGVDYMVMIDFNLEYAAVSPEDFIARICEGNDIKAIFCGYDYTFGDKGAGDAELMEQLAPKYGYEAHILSPVTVEGEAVSSTGIRQALSIGDMEKVSMLLGRDYGTQATLRSKDARNLTFDLEEKGQPGNGKYDVMIAIGENTYYVNADVFGTILMCPALGNIMNEKLFSQAHITYLLRI